MQIASRLNRQRQTIYSKAKWLHKKGLLKDKDFPRTRPINPGRQDFDAVKMDYCRKHHITIAELCARLERDDKLAADLYRQAQAAKLARVTGRLEASKEKNGHRTGGMGPGSAAHHGAASRPGTREAV